MKITDRANKEQQHARWMNDMDIHNQSNEEPTVKTTHDTRHALGGDEGTIGSVGGDGGSGGITGGEGGGGITGGEDGGVS